MQNKIITLLALGIALPVVNLQAQDAATERPSREGREGRGPRGDRPIPGIFGALDANNDRKLDKTEIAGATDALKKLDKDSDGKLTAAELRGGMGRGPRPDGDAPQGDRPNRGPRNDSEERAGQRPQGDRPAVGGGGPFVAALDANKDGSLDADELKGAPAALGKLDKNSDGEVTMEELGVVRGRIGQGRGGEGGQPGRGPRGDRKAGETTPEQKQQ
ncbi:MAG TPA: hypothetical protein VF773_17630 [Verrucomicrobiae bacterium]